MATTYTEIRGFLDELKIKYQAQDDREEVGMFWTTQNYTDRKGDKSLLLVLRLLEKGELLQVFAPQVYSYKDGPHKLAVLQACLMADWRTKLVQFEYDAADGEIRATVDLPLEDAKLTARQLRRVIRSVVGVVDEFDPFIRKAVETGEISAHPGGRHERLLEVLTRLQGLPPDQLDQALAALAGLGGKAGGGEPPPEL